MTFSIALMLDKACLHLLNFFSSLSLVMRGRF